MPVPRSVRELPLQWPENVALANPTSLEPGNRLGLDHILANIGMPLSATASAANIASWAEDKRMAGMIPTAFIRSRICFGGMSNFPSVALESAAREF